MALSLYDPMGAGPVKVVVAGPFGAGKTTFVSSCAQGRVLSAEAGVTDATSALKGTTTVAMDHATTRVASMGAVHEVSLFGLPGQERFRFMWPVLARGLDAVLFLVDASRVQSRAQLKGTVRAFSAIDPRVPRVIAANRWDRDALPARVLAGECGLAEDDVVDCDPRDRDACVRALAVVLERLPMMSPRSV